MRFQQPFAHRHAVLPVIHVEERDQALRNAEIARAAGADGVFLINHTHDWRHLLDVHKAVVRSHPGWWVGVNCLDLDPIEVFGHIINTVSGVWVDNARIVEDQPRQLYAQSVLHSQDATGWTGLCFGGVAFKYQRDVNDLAAAARIAAKFTDVVTTSGPGTGKAAHVDKIRIMEYALGDVPLAIASGITPENVHEYLPVSDCYLVATGISKSFVDLDAGLLQELVDTVRAFDT